MKKFFLLLSKSAMLIIMIALLGFYSCGKSEDVPPTPTPPTPPVLVNGLNFKSILPKETVIANFGFKVSKTENLEGIFTILKDNGSTKDTTVMRSAMKASAEVVLPEVIPAINVGATLGTLNINKISRISGSPLGNIIPITGKYEIAGFANGMKIPVNTLTDSTNLTAYGRNVGFKYGSELVPVEASYDDAAAVVQDGVTIVDGKEMIKVKYFLSVKFKDATNEKVLPVEVTVQFNRQEFDPFVGSPVAVITNSALTAENTYNAKFEITKTRKSGATEVVTKEVAMFVSFTGDSEKKIYANDEITTLVAPALPSVTTSTTTATRDGLEITQEKKVYLFTFSMGSSKVTTVTEKVSVTIDGTVYNSLPLRQTVGYGSGTETATNKFQETGFKTQYFKLIFSLGIEGLSNPATIAVTNDCYVLSPSFGIDVAETLSKAGASWSMVINTKTTVFVGIFGTRATGGGIAVYTYYSATGKFVKTYALPWESVGTLGARNTAARDSRGIWHICSVTVEGTDYVAKSVMIDYLGEEVWRKPIADMPAITSSLKETTATEKIFKYTTDVEYLVNIPIKGM